MNEQHCPERDGGGPAPALAGHYRTYCDAKLIGRLSEVTTLKGAAEIGYKIINRITGGAIL